MSLKEEIDVLKRIPWFSGMPESKLKLIAFTSDRLRYQAGDVVFEEGDVTDSIYIIISGDVEVQINLPSGVLTVATISTYGIFGEIGMVSEVPRTATIAAFNELEVLRIEKTFFMQLLTDFPTISKIVMNELGRRLSRMIKIISKVPKDQMEVIIEEIDREFEF